MNNRESSIKASKNKLRGILEERVAVAKQKAKPEPLSLEEQAATDAKASAKAQAKAEGFARFLAKKAERKRLRSKHHAPALMDTLRRIRIADISKYDLDYANQSLAWAKDKLDNLKNIHYNGNIPNTLFLDIHLTTDDIYLLEKRVEYLLDKQLEEYHAAMPPYSWDKKKACRLLREATEPDIIRISLENLFPAMADALYRIPSATRLDALRNFAVILKSQGYISVQRCKELIGDCALSE